MASAVSAANMNSSCHDPNGRSAASRARNRGASSNSGPSTSLAHWSPAASSSAIEGTGRSAATIGGDAVTRDQQRHVIRAGRVLDVELERHLPEEAAAVLVELEREPEDP